jgi:ADP-ribose pyrophosphatase
MGAWIRVEPTKVTKVGWRTIVSKMFILPNGLKAVFDTMHDDGQEFVNVIALTPQNLVVVARQYRPGPEKYMDELPGGFVDEHEDRESAMRRELLEETGYRAGRITYVGASHKDTYLNAAWHTYLAYDCTPQKEQDLEDVEQIEVRLIGIDDLIRNAQTDAMTDHAAVIMAYNELQKISSQ